MSGCSSDREKRHPVQRPPDRCHHRARWSGNEPRRSGQQVLFPHVRPPRSGSVPRFALGLPGTPGGFTRHQSICEHGDKIRQVGEVSRVSDAGRSLPSYPGRVRGLLAYGQIADPRTSGSSLSVIARKSTAKNVNVPRHPASAELGQEQATLKDEVPPSERCRRTHEGAAARDLKRSEVGSGPQATGGQAGSRRLIPRCTGRGGRRRPRSRSPRPSPTGRPHGGRRRSPASSRSTRTRGCCSRPGRWAGRRRARPW